ncbi:hypothetical protein CROQUDRAFT_702249, partial [Cronartium quercuum f. sp. fusiforme G11]
GKPKGVRCVLEEQGLWEYQVSKSNTEKPRLVFQRPTCKLSAINCDRTAREYQLEREKTAQEAYENGQESDHPPLQEIEDPVCRAAKIYSLQSDFANKTPFLQTIIKQCWSYMPIPSKISL